MRTAALMLPAANPMDASFAARKSTGGASGTGADFQFGRAPCARLRKHGVQPSPRRASLRNVVTMAPSDKSIGTIIAILAKAIFRDNGPLSSATVPRHTQAFFERPSRVAAPAPPSVRFGDQRTDLETERCFGSIAV